MTVVDKARSSCLEATSGLESLTYDASRRFCWTVVGYKLGSRGRVAHVLGEHLVIGRVGLKCLNPQWLAV